MQDLHQPINTILNPIHVYNCPCCNGPNYVEAQLEDLDKVLKEKFTPRGANNPLDAQPIVLEYNEDQIDDIIKFFEELMADQTDLDLKDLLYAKPIGTKPSSEDPLYKNFQGNWEWDHDNHKYQNTVTKEEITEADKNDLSIVFIESVLVYFLGNVASLLHKDISIQTWLLTMRTGLQNSMGSQYMLGAGGKNTMTNAGSGRMGSTIGNQNGHLQNFAGDIQDGNLTGGQVLGRTQMYGESGTHAYEEGKADSHDIPLPAYPADGNQDCYSNCRCYWDIEDGESDTGIISAYWRLNASAKHCDTCLFNARQWNPFIYRRETSVTDEIDRELGLDDEEFEDYEDDDDI